MIVKNILEEDFINYKKPSMFIAFPNCSFKCDKENGNQYCQNWPLVKQPNINIDVKRIVDKYISNNLTEAVVCGGLEPFDDFDELVLLVDTLRTKTKDDIAIYSGYTETEVVDKINVLLMYDNIIVKFGRYRPGQNPHYDETLGVNLASDNQYAKRIS